MFGFKKTPCVDMDLYGYFTQAVGGTLNRLNATGGGTLNAEDVLELVDHMLNQRKRTIDSRQVSLLKFAADAVSQNYNRHDNNKMKIYCNRFAEMLRSEFDFNDPAFRGLQVELMLLGCSFNH